MSKRNDIDILNDILIASKRACEYCSDMNYETFTKDNKTQDAVIRNIEIVGEATKQLSESMHKSSKSIPWKSMAGMRDKLIHHYFGINIDIVWNVVKNDLPSIIDKLKKIIK